MEADLKNNLAKWGIKGYDKEAVKVANAYLNLYVKQSAENFKQFNKKHGGRHVMPPQYYDKNYKINDEYGVLLRESSQVPLNAMKAPKQKTGGRIAMPCEYYGHDSGRYFPLKKGGRKIIPQTDRNHAYGNSFNVSDVTFKNVAKKTGASTLPKHDLCAIKKNFEEDLGGFIAKVSNQTELKGHDLMNAFKEKLY